VVRTRTKTRITHFPDIPAPNARLPTLEPGPKHRARDRSGCASTLPAPSDPEKSVLRRSAKYSKDAVAEMW
jgi:hypothetical protein